MNAMMAELFGKVTGCCKGKGGSMHIGDLQLGMLPAIAIVGANIPIVAGMALAFKLRRQPRVAVSFFGDGASNEGAFHEGLNMAAVYGVPAVFICENNFYGASTPASKVMKIDHIAQRADAYGMPGKICDGMDVFEVYAAARSAVDEARAGRGPTLLELKTFRLCGHSRRDPNNYMTDQEKEHWQNKDPLPICEQILKHEDVVSDAKIAQIRAAVDDQVEQAVTFARQSPEPEPDDTYADVYATMEVPR